MTFLVLDFETYFDPSYSLTKLSIPEYVHDSRFHVHGLAIRDPDGETRFETDVPGALAALQATYGDDLERTTVVCHNAAFDGYVLYHRYGIKPRFFVDTLLLSSHVHGRKEHGFGKSARLKDLALYYNLDPKGSIEALSGIRFLSSQQYSALSDYAQHDAFLTAEIAQRLLPHVSRPEIELPIMNHTLTLAICRSVCVDVERIPTLVTAATDEMSRLLDQVGLTPTEVASSAKFGSVLAAALSRTGRSLPMKPGARGPIPAIAKNDPAMQALMEDDDPTVAGLVQARLGRSSQHALAKRLERLMRITTATGNVLPVTLTYYGAHTGRFSGGGGFNIQNMGRDGAGAHVRHLLRARPDHRFIIADWSQIEARITAWYAEEHGLLAAFASNRDIYSEKATVYFGREVRKPRAGDSPEAQREFKQLRNVGKAAVLGLGFGEGCAKFEAQLRSNPDIAPLFSTNQLSSARCYDIVHEFRHAYPGIPDLWRSFEDAFRRALGGGDCTVVGCRFYLADHQVNIQLPSGRTLHYPTPHLASPEPITYMERDGTMKEFTPTEPQILVGSSTKIYGGLLCENIVQSTARDILVEAILALETSGISVLFHVHDEIVVEVPLEHVEDATTRMRAVMEQPPPWMPSLPLACDLRIAADFGKD